MRKLLEMYIRKHKNPYFRFDDAIDDGVIFLLIKRKFFSYIRGLKLFPRLNLALKIYAGKNIDLFNKKNIQVGNNIVLGDFVRLCALGRGGLAINDNVTIGAYTQLVISTSFNNIGENIYIGNNVAIGEFSYLGGAGGLEIGNDTIIGQYFSTHPENHIFSDPNNLIRHQGVSRSGIKIGSNCWIGAKVTILDGVNIGDNSVIAAGAVVTKSFKRNVLLGGVPAKVIKEL